MFLNTLSGRFLILTAVFVMLAEILIFVPSVARFREDYLLLRLERAQIASLVLLANDMIEEELEAELLKNAGVFNVVLARDEVRQLMLSSTMPSAIESTYDLRDPGAWTLIMDAISCLLEPENHVIRVIGHPVQEAGLLIEVTMQSGPLRTAMIDYGIRILALSAVISVLTAFLLFFAVRYFIVKPIKGVVGAMKSYAEAPEDARRIIDPSAGVIEIREAETALQMMQVHLTGALHQKERLAQLGGAVAKISHDLRNILTTSQLFTDGMGQSDDPYVKRTIPKLLNSISRAVNLCESTLAFGKAEEPAPSLDRISLIDVVDDVVDGERIAVADFAIAYDVTVPAGMVVRADPEQLYRVLSNLIRNARQAIVTRGAPGKITVTAQEDDTAWTIQVADTGPGLPKHALDHLFQPFQGGVRKGGTGLGLAIAEELVRGHGGQLELLESSEAGTCFAISLPKSVVTLDTAAE
ncbi:MAG: HAMP domain-containing sensor histidine kinase [Paracoccaceae bacterium]